MPQRASQPRIGNLHLRLTGIALVLIAANLAAWGWALLALHHHPVLIGTALLAYGLGLRHAVDADHIAAIDNVTRKLMQEGKRPVAVGLFFSLGHATVVVLVSVGVASATLGLSHHARLHAMGTTAGTAISALFLLAIASRNGMILAAIVRTFRQVAAGAPYVEEDFDLLLAGRGLLARLLRPLLGMIRQSWQMFPLGFLFGLGFDTATEVGLLGMSATGAAHDLPRWSILVFPALFTAGMALVDTADSVLMLGAYGWAFVHPMRKLYYNMTITFMSVIVALLVGGMEALGLAASQFGLHGPFWDGIGALNDHSGTAGFAVVALFIACWIASALIYRARATTRSNSARADPA